VSGMSYEWRRRIKANDDGGRQDLSAIAAREARIKWILAKSDVESTKKLWSSKREITDSARRAAHMTWN
jgi:hypothetical protein